VTSLEHVDDSYQRFLREKVCVAPSLGVDLDAGAMRAT